MSKSNVMRSMFEEGKTVSEISHELNANYAFVYGVIQRYCQKTGRDMPTATKTGSKSEQIRQMFDDGKTIGQIAKELNANYSYVWSVCDKHRKGEVE